MEDEEFEQELKDIMRSAVPKNAHGTGHQDRQISVQGSGNYVANGPIIFASAKSSPPALPAGSSRTCPQCGDVNWITKRHCKTCEMDLFAYAARGHHAKVIKRFWYLTAGFAVASLASFFIAAPILKKFGMDSAALVVSVVGLGFGAFAFMSLKVIEQHSDARRRL